jgi:predicted DNA-binding protein YlxM (UPF0122 family)
MNKERKKDIGRVHLHLRILNHKVKEWEKVLKFLKKKRSKIDVDTLIKEAITQRNNITIEMRKWISSLKNSPSDRKR